MKSRYGFARHMVLALPHLAFFFPAALVLLIVATNIGFIWLFVAFLMWPTWLVIVLGMKGIDHYTK